MLKKQLEQFEEKLEEEDISDLVFIDVKDDVVRMFLNESDFYIDERHAEISFSDEMELTDFTVQHIIKRIKNIVEERKTQKKELEQLFIQNKNIRNIVSTINLKKSIFLVDEEVEVKYFFDGYNIEIEIIFFIDSKLYYYTTKEFNQTTTFEEFQSELSFIDDFLKECKKLTQ